MIHSEFDLVVLAGNLLPMKKGEFQILQNRGIGIKNSRIEWLGSAEEAKSLKCKKIIDASKQTVLPGLINGHTHLSMSLFRGLADDLPFEQWLHKYILPLEAKAVDSNFVKIGAKLSALEAIKFGTTTLVDMYYFQEETAEALDTAGLRAWIGETVADFPPPDDKKKENLNYRILDRLSEKYSNHSRIKPCVAPHAPYTCGDETLKIAAAYAEKKGLPLSIHVSETKFENSESLKVFGKTPTQRLYDLGFLGRTPTVFAHGVHLSDEDISILIKTHTGVVHNPESNMKLGSGIAPVANMIQRNIRLGLGTDGVASNNDLSLFSEMDTAAKLQKLALSNNAAISAIDVLEMATIRGAEALNMEKEIGSIELGKKADLITVDLNYPHTQPVNGLASTLVYSCKGLEVQNVICEGKLILENQKALTLNQEEIILEAQKMQAELQGFL